MFDAMIYLKNEWARKSAATACDGTFGARLKLPKMFGLFCATFFYMLILEHSNQA